MLAIGKLRSAAANLQEQTTTFAFPNAGDYVEQIEGTQNLASVVAGALRTLMVPSNYGCIWTVAST